jgi:apolipoprotein N-acyltransferase
LPAARIKSLLPWIAAVIGGILIFTGYVGFDQFYLEWICLVPVLWALRDATPRRAFLIGWLAGTVGHAGGFYWIVGMFQQFAGAPWPVGAAGLLLLAAANGALVATWSCALRFISRPAGATCGSPRCSGPRWKSSGRKCSPTTWGRASICSRT